MTDSFFHQFFDRSLWKIWGALVAVHAVAALVQDTSWSWVPLAVIGILTFWISKKSMTTGLAVAMLEMFVGGHGHLLDASVAGFSLSLRMVIFAAVMLAWLVDLLRRRIHFTFVAQRDMPWAFLLIAVFLGSVTGFLRNDMRAAFDDMNSYLTIAYLLPIISVVWTPERKRELLRAFFASAVWIAMTTLVMLFAFTHLSVNGIWALYDFVRDARIAEVTLLSGPEWLVNLLPTGPWYFRIFQQSQFVVVAFELLLIAATLLVWKTEKFPKYLPVLHTFMIATIIASQSRSFWLGAAVAACALLVAALVDGVRVRGLARTVGLGALSTTFAVVLLWMIVVLPPRPNLFDSPYYRGKDDDTRELAVSSRWNLLGPMMDKIGEEPLWGSGFGTSVTFISDDPRIRAINEAGEWTTYRFEWGYQDIWLKMGIPGLLAAAWYFGVVLYATWRSLQEKRERRWLMVGLAAGVVTLFVSHMFSPYLNHPIGLGFMLFLVPFLGWNRSTDAHEAAIEPAGTAQLTPQLARPQVGVVTSERA